LPRTNIVYNLTAFTIAFMLQKILGTG